MNCDWWEEEEQGYEDHRKIHIDLLPKLRTANARSIHLIIVSVLPTYYFGIFYLA